VDSGKQVKDDVGMKRKDSRRNCKMDDRSWEGQTKSQSLLLGPYHLVIFMDNITVNSIQNVQTPQPSTTYNYNSRWRNRRRSFGHVILHV
jgi:hypothetical protein